MSLVTFEGTACICRVRPSRALIHAVGLELGVSARDAEHLLRGVSGGAGFTDATELAVLNHVMGKGTLTPNALNYVALSSTTPTADTGANFTEPSTGAYARVSTQGTTATGPAWNTATGTAPAYVDNSGVITFPAATADWSAAANLTHFGIFSVATVGTVQIWGALTTPKPILNGDTGSFAANAIRIQLGDPGDTY